MGLLLTNIEQHQCSLTQMRRRRLANTNPTYGRNVRRIGQRLPLTRHENSVSKFQASFDSDDGVVPNRPLVGPSA